MNNKYLQIKLSVPEEFQDSAVALLSDLNFTGIEQVNDLMIINFPATIINVDIENELLINLDSLNCDIKIVSKDWIVEKNWNEEWEKSVEAITIDNDIIISPTWKADQFENAKYLIKIDPKMSFGTGTHTTTRLAAKLIKSNITEVEIWYDAGTGTGVLAILLSLLGAKEVYAFDIDDWSVKNAIENLKINNISNVQVSKLDLNKGKLKSVNGIVANMFANIIIDNMKKFKDAVSESNGMLICTGIMKFDKSKVIDSAENEGLKLTDELNEDEWTALKFEVNN